MNLKELLANGTVRRWALGGLVTLIALANGKFQLGLSDAVMIGIITLAIAVLTGSNYKEAQVAIAGVSTEAGTSPLAGGIPGILGSLLGSSGGTASVSASASKTPEDAAAAIGRLP